MENCSKEVRPTAVLMEGGGVRRSRSSDIPMRVRRRQSDARWRANVASCFETLKNIIPVNKRASKRQISKAYVLQETSKHIHFLEGILITLLQEKAREEGKEAESYVERFDEIKTDFIKKQKQKIAALCNERKYKRNKYKLYIADNLIQSEEVESVKENTQAQKKVVPEALTRAPRLPSPRKSAPQSQPQQRKARGPVQPKSQTLRVIVHPMKHILNRVRKPKEHKDFVPTDSSLAGVLKSSSDPLHILESDCQTSTPKYKQRKNGKRHAASKENRAVKRNKASILTNASTTSGIFPNPGLNTRPFVGASRENNVKVEATNPQYFYCQIRPSCLDDQRVGGGFGHFIPQPERSCPSPRSDTRVRISTGDISLPPEYTDHTLAGLKTGATTPVLTSIHLNSTPAKDGRPSRAFSTPTGSGTPGAPFKLSLTPITKMLDSSDQDQLLTPRKQIQSQTDASPGLCFTPIVLPNDWMCTPTKNSASPNSSFNSEHKGEGHAPLECDEAISSDEECPRKSTRSLLASGFSQAFQHRESKLHPTRTRHRTASFQGENGNSSAKSCFDKNESRLSCKRSLNMSLVHGHDESSSTGESDLWTEECLQDFDKYYEELKEAKNRLDVELETGDWEDLVPLEAVWDLMESEIKPEQSDQNDSLSDLGHHQSQAAGEHTDSDIERFICGYVGGNCATDEFMPLESLGSFLVRPEANDVCGMSLPSNVRCESRESDQEWITYRINGEKDDLVIDMATGEHAMNSGQPSKAMVEVKEEEVSQEEAFNRQYGGYQTFKVSGEEGEDWRVTCLENVAHEEVIPPFQDFIAENENGWKLEVDTDVCPMLQA